MEVFDCGRVAVSNWSLYLLGDLDANIELPITNGVAAAGRGIVSILVATDDGEVEVRVESHDGPPPGPVVEAGDDVVELSWRPGAEQVSWHTTFWEIEADPIPLPWSADGCYVVQVHTHNRDAVDGLAKIPKKFANRERITIRIWPGRSPDERILALGSRLGRARWKEARGRLPEVAQEAPRAISELVFGETIELSVAYNAFFLRDESFVVPTDFTEGLALSAAKLNGLVSNVNGSAIVRTGTGTGKLRLNVRLELSPVLSESDLAGIGIALGPKDDAVLVAHGTDGHMSVMVVDEVIYRLPAIPAGRYGMVVVATGRDAADRAPRRRSKATPPSIDEGVTVVLWPDPEHVCPEDLVLQNASKFAQIIIADAERIREQVAVHYATDRPWESP